MLESFLENVNYCRLIRNEIYLITKSLYMKKYLFLLITFLFHIALNAQQITKQDYDYHASATLAYRIFAMVARVDWTKH